MTPDLLNTIGLVANIGGVGLAFFFGYPQPSHEEGVGIGLEDSTPFGGSTVGDYNRQITRRKRIYLTCSRIGLALMFSGFILQLAAVWLPKV